MLRSYKIQRSSLKICSTKFFLRLKFKSLICQNPTQTACKKQILLNTLDINDNMKKKVSLILIILSSVIILLMMLPFTQSFFGSLMLSPFNLLIPIMLFGMISFGVLSFFNLKSWLRIILTLVFTGVLYVLWIIVMILLYGMGI